VKERFGLTRVVFVADRGILRDIRIREDLAPQGLDWVTALRRPDIRDLLVRGAFQPSLFDEVDAAEIEDKNFPGERLVVCRNPFQAEERARRRYTEIIERGGEADFEKILAGVRMRDEIDSTRAFSPLRAAGDAVILDSDKLNADEVFAKVEALCR